MKVEKLSIDCFETRLGKVELILTTSPNAEIHTSTRSILVKTISHLVEVIAFDDMKQWVDATNPIEKGMGWIIRVLKTNDLSEKFSMECSLNPNNEKVTADIDPGESLDSLWIENEWDVVSIGTEDGEMMKFRAEKEDWMPIRFKEKLGYQSNAEFSFTTYTNFGLKTNVPVLNNGEKIYFHYLIATNKKKKSNYSPEEDDISTHLAVDFPKWTLTKRLQLPDEITKH